MELPINGLAFFMMDWKMFGEDEFIVQKANVGSVRLHGADFG